MKLGTRLVLWSMLPLSAGCLSMLGAVPTIPYPVSATAAIQRNDLEIPRDLEVRSANYSVTGLRDARTDAIVQMRPLLTVYAVNRSTGEQLLLIYDDLAQRKQPSQIIRIVPASDSGRIGR